MRRTLTVAFIVVAAACGTDHTSNPVGDSGDTRTVTDPPAGSALSDVSGTWTARISYVYPDDWCACCRPASQASATFTQDGSQVRGVIHGVCFDEELTGTLQAGQLSGAVKVSDSTVVYNGQATGQATRDRFYLTTSHLERDGGHAVSGFTVTFSR